jgi:hypothetical protein
MKIESCYKHFLLIPVSHIPIVGEHGDLIGLLSKDKISREMADLDSYGVEYESIPEHLMEFEITEGILYFFQNFRKIFVINKLGEKVDSWEKPRFLAEFSSFIDKGKAKEPVPKAIENIENHQEQKNKELIFKMMEMILKNFSDALFATDKDGNTTFFNQRFEEFILTKELFKDSINLAEKYFKELNRDLISDYIKKKESEGSSPDDFPILQVFLKSLELHLKIVTLRNDDKIFGFLYQFIEKFTPNLSINEEESIFPSFDKAFQQKTPLNDVMKEAETAYIQKAYILNHENISHTANFLGIPRSTLQNRMKYLGLSNSAMKDSAKESSIKSKKKENFEISELDEDVPLNFEEEIQKAEDLENESNDSFFTQNDEEPINQNNIQSLKEKISKSEKAKIIEKQTSKSKKKIIKNEEKKLPKIHSKKKAVRK